MSDHRLPLTLCWHCDRPLDAASHPQDDTIKPEPGAVSLCLYCGAVAFFGEDMRLIPPTKEQLDELGNEEEFRRSYLSFAWARQYIMIKSSLMRPDEGPDR